MHTRLVFWWKTSNPEVTKEKVRGVLLALKGIGRRVAVLNVDSTNERFFATDLRSHVSDLCPVNLVNGGEAAEYKGESMSMKAYLGNLLANAAEDGRLSLPMHPYCSAPG